MLLTLLILLALSFKRLVNISNKKAEPDTTVYTVEGMHCSHCEAAVERAVEEVQGVKSAKANVRRKTLTIKGTAAQTDVQAAVEKTGYTFKGKKE